MEPAAAYQVLAPEAYVQIKNLIEKTVASGLIYLNSHANDFKTPELRQYLDLYLRGSGGVDAVERVKLMKLLWDAVGHRVRRPARALRDQLLRAATRRSAATRCSARWRRASTTAGSIRRDLHGRIRPRRLDSAGSDVVAVRCRPERRSVARSHERQRWCRSRPRGIRATL